MSRVSEHNERDCQDFYIGEEWREGGWCFVCGNHVRSEVELAVAKALRHAAHTMPIETLHGADGASVWLHDYAERFGEQP